MHRYMNDEFEPEDEKMDSDFEYDNDPTSILDEEGAEEREVADWDNPTLEYDEVQEGDNTQNKLRTEASDTKTGRLDRKRESTPKGDWLAQYKWPEEMADADAYLNNYYHTHQGLIRKVMRPYRPIDPRIDENEYLGQAYIALIDAAEKFDWCQKRMKFSSFYVWFLQNHFGRLVGHKDRYVLVYDAEGEYLEMMEYSEYLKKKKRLMASGMKAEIKSRIEPYDENGVVPGKGPNGRRSSR